MGQELKRQAASTEMDLLDALPVEQDLAAGHEGKGLFFVDRLKHFVHLGF